MFQIASDSGFNNTVALVAANTVASLAGGGASAAAARPAAC